MQPPRRRRPPSTIVTTVNRFLPQAPRRLGVEPALHLRKPLIGRGEPTRFAGTPRAALDLRQAGRASTRRPASAALAAGPTWSASRIAPEPGLEVEVRQRLPATSAAPLADRISSRRRRPRPAHGAGGAPDRRSSRSVEHRSRLTSRAGCRYRPSAHVRSGRAARPTERLLDQAEHLVRLAAVARSAMASTTSSTSCLATVPTRRPDQAGGKLPIVASTSRAVRSSGACTGARRFGREVLGAVAAAAAARA